MSMVHAHVAFALPKKHDFLASSNRGYRKVVKNTKQKALDQHDAREIRSDIGQAVHTVHA